MLEIGKVDKSALRKIARELLNSRDARPC